MAASVVDLPEPVPPTTSTSPRFVMITSFSTSGRPSFSKFGICAAMVRMTIPTWRCCTNTLTRKRESPAMEIAKLHSISFSNSARCSSFMSESASSRVTSPVSRVCASGCMVPCAFMLGGKSWEMKRSLPPCALIAARSLCMYAWACSRFMVRAL